MILEIVLIDIKPGFESDFEFGIEKASAIFRAAKGCQNFQCWRSIEKPRRYRLFVQWETLEHHTEGFFGKQAWKDYRALVSHTFEAAPQLEHIRKTLDA